MRKRARVAGAVIAAVVLALAVFVARGGRVPERTAKRNAAEAVNAAKAPAPLPTAKVPGAPAPNLAAAVPAGPPDDKLVQYMRERFGARLDDKHTQIKAVEKLVDYLMKHYPDDWRERVYEYLKKVFPDRADELYGKFEKLNRYNEWLEGSRAEIMKMSPELRRQTMWDLRRSIFGAEAEEIWAVERKNERIQEALEDIAKSPETTVDEKLQHYLDGVKGAYGDQAGQLIQKRQTELMTSFLGVESVQDDLHAMAPQLRTEMLRELRRAMGLDEDALKRWDALDQQRDRSWDRGQRYTEQRGQVVEKYRGDEQRRQLIALQEQLFGEDADVIRSEEASGFYRFQHRRAFGKE